MLKKILNERVDMDSSNTVYGAFSLQVSKHPTACAIREPRGDLTYQELDALINRIARQLPRRASRVGVVMEHGALQIATLLAVLKTGTAYVPAEPDLPLERTRFMMGECEVEAVVTNARLAAALDGFNPMIAEDLAAGRDGADVDSPSYSVSPEDPAYVLYTSGTTGTPKGVVVENRNVCHYARAFHHEFNNGMGDTMLQYSVCSFDIFVEEVFTTLLAGATLAIPSTETKEDMDLLMDFVRENEVTIISGFPYLLADINERGTVPPRVRLLISGGDVLRKRYVSKLLNQTEIYNTYGPSETTVCCSYFRCDNAPALEDGSYPIGKAVQGSTVAILDDDLQPVEPGRVGEICIGGAGVSRGYVDVSKNASFVTDGTGNRLYRSGDMGYELPSGDLAFLRREDSQVMILGRRVELNEVESVLNRCDGVKAGVVRADADTHGLSYLTAYLVPEAGNFDLDRVKGQMARYLASFMVPEFFVLLNKLPRNANGKPDTDNLPTVLKSGTY